jgi:hypothetical protein
VKNFLRVGSSAQTGKSVSAGSNPDKAVATFPSRATGFESGTLCGPGHRPGPHLRNIMFDSATPAFSGSLAGEAFAATVESHPRYPNLRSDRHGALFRMLDDIVDNHVASLAGILHDLGFDDVRVEVYRASALTAFRAARPSI